MRKTLFILLTASAIFAQDCFLIFTTAGEKTPDYTGVFYIAKTCNDPIKAINGNDIIRSQGKTAADYIITAEGNLWVVTPKH